VILPLWRRQPPDQFVDFHNQDKRIKALEATIARHRAIFALIRAYVMADEGIWAVPARALLEALDEELGE
jgi:nitrate reductase assembly molybdenum cofactor insertion protein NarJ